MSAHDLTPTMAKYLEPHMLIPLFDFLAENNVRSQTDLDRIQLKLLHNTRMADYAIDIFKRLHGDDAAVPEALEKLGEGVHERLDAGEAELAPLVALLGDETQMRELQAMGNLTPTWLHEHHGIPLDCLDKLYAHARFVFQCGDYKMAAEYLGFFLVAEPPSTSVRGFHAAWGRLASLILESGTAEEPDWDEALKMLEVVREAIENKSGATPLEQLQQRSWLLHWSLFIFFNHSTGIDGLVDFFMAEKNMNAIQVNCPWLLRYLTAAVIVNKRRRNVLKELVRVIEKEKHEYGDPITQFLESLYVDFDFDKAQSKLTECADLIKSDYFLANQKDAFTEEARLFIFETYCRIHKKIDLAELAKKLGMETTQQAEVWIVELIVGALLDAKIDSEQQYVVMGASHPTIHQQVILKTRDLTQRTALMQAKLNKILDAATAPPPRARGADDD